MASEAATRFHPIIYVRGYAGSESGVEETVATPYMGFNLGATKVRQRWNGEVVRHVFESPLVRLMKDFGYEDVYSHGDVIAAAEPMRRRSVVIYRYYDQVSKDLGTGVRPDIEVYAEGLHSLIARVRKQVLMSGEATEKDFRVFLVAHSMGGLIVRTFLQNEELKPVLPDDDDQPIPMPVELCRANRACVDKAFTYATPHNGIDVKVIGNLPGFFTRNNQDNFNRESMRKYMGIRGGGERADSLDGKFNPERFFSLVGTNAKDYAAAGGWSSRVVGPVSDGLVRIDNATVQGTPRAFVHRSHSADYGIVNSEEGYQNLTRFLFGDVRVDGRLVIHDLTLPTVVEKARVEGKKIQASYHFEAVVRPRGARYDLHRRLVSENSAIFRNYEDLWNRHPRLFSIYLATRNRSKKRGPLVFAIDLGVKVPEYEVDRTWRRDLHIEGSDLFRKTLILAAVPPKTAGDPWRVKYGFNVTASDPTPTEAKRVESTGAGGLKFEISIMSSGRPRIDATLELTASAWS